MEITPKITFVSGSFDTKDTQMECVTSSKYMSVELCIKSNKDKGWNIPIAAIKLYSRDRYIDAKEVFEDACKLGHEIVRRWNDSENKN